MQNHRFQYNEAMPVESCTQSLCDLSLAFGEDEEGGGGMVRVLIPAVFVSRGGKGNVEVAWRAYCRPDWNKFQTRVESCGTGSCLRPIIAGSCWGQSTCMPQQPRLACR